MLFLAINWCVFANRPGSNGLGESRDAIVSTPNSNHFQHFLGCIHVYVALPNAHCCSCCRNLISAQTTWSFVERKDKPRRATDSIRFTPVRLSRWFDWRNAQVAVKPDTLIRWHRKGFYLFWK
jgi:hypothetical protein